MPLELGPILRTFTRRKGASTLVVLELGSAFIIISCLLIASAWYLARGYRPGGYSEADLVIIDVHAAAPADPMEAARAAVGREGALLATLGRMPGVRAISPISTSVLDQRPLFPTGFRLAGSAPRAAAYGWTIHASASIGDVLDLQVLEGAFPDGGTGGGDRGVTVLTRCLRDRLFPGGGPALGRTVFAEDAAPARVVGVVENVIMKAEFFPHSECVAFRFGYPPDDREAAYLVRAAPGQRRRLLAALVTALGPSRPDRRVAVAAHDASRATHNQFAVGIAELFLIIVASVALMTLFGAMAVASFLVAERRRSIGIRRALGATRPDIVRFFLVESLVSTALGIGLGLVGTLAFFLLMQRVFPQLELPGHALVLPAVVIWITGTVAALIPARRASQIPPWVASRGSPG